MKKNAILGVLLFVLTGCFSQHLYYDESKYSWIIEDLKTKGDFYLLLPIKSNEKMYELCIDWSVFNDLYIYNGNFIDTTRSRAEQNAQYLKGFKVAQEEIKKIYSGKHKYFEVDNLETSIYKDYIIDEAYYDENFKGKDLTKILIKYAKHNVRTVGYEHLVKIDNSIFSQSKGDVEKESLIKYLILNEFWVKVGGFDGRFSAFDRSKEGNKIPWKEIKESWKD